MHLDYFEHDGRRTGNVSLRDTQHRDIVTGAARDGHNLEKINTRVVREGPGVYCDVSNFIDGTHLRVAVALSESHVGPAMFGY
jgi:hypothetical protein